MSNPEYIEREFTRAAQPVDDKIEIIWNGDPDEESPPWFDVFYDGEPTAYGVRARRTGFDIVHLSEDAVHRPVGTYRYPHEVLEAIKEEI